MSQITQVGFIDTTIYASDFITDNGTATVVGNEIEILGGTNITTDGAGNIVNVHLNDAIFWPDTNDSFTEGAIHIGNEVFMHNLNENTALGNDALLNVTTGTNNVGIGENALINLTTGERNVAIGSPGTGITSGSNNIGIGHGVFGFTGVTGSFNIAIGDTSLLDIQDGEFNVAIKGLNRLVSGDNNIAIGSRFRAGYNYTGSESNNVVICNNGVTGESNKIRIGTDGTGNAQQDEAFIAGLVHGARGFEADSGNVTLLATNAGATDGAINIGNSHIHMDANNEIFIGNSAGNIDSGTENIGIGTNTLSAITSGSNNAIVGSNSCTSMTTGYRNAVLGWNSMTSATGANNNTIIGHSTAQNLLNSDRCTMIGYLAGNSYTASESSNVLIRNQGVAGESNVMRLGTSGSGPGRQDNTYVAGTYGRDVNSNPQVMIMSNDDKQGTMQSTQFRAELSSTQNNVTGTAGTVYKVPFNIKSFDGFGDYNTSTHEFTAPIDGLYYFEGNLSLDNVDSSADMVVLRFYVSGVEHRVERFNPSGLGTGPNNTLIVHGSLLLELTESDVAYLTIEVTGQSSNQVDVISSSNLRTYFSGYLIRPR